MFIMLGYIFLGFYHILMPGIFYSKNTKLLPVFRGIGAITNIVLNIILIPKFGVLGAAIATTGSFIIMVTPLYIKANKLFYIPFYWKHTSVLFLIALLIYFINLIIQISFMNSILIFIGFIYITIITIMKLK